MADSNSIMRTVSFVERIEIEFHGNIITQTMVLADVDNDLANELVVGNIEGQIAVFKGDNSTPWKKTSVSGMLTCLAVGEIHIPNKNSLVCITAEGWCYVYDVSSHVSIQSQNLSTDDNSQFAPVFTQELPANARVMCLADIDSDGLIEMVIGYSDRVVRAFKWHVPSGDVEGGHFILLQKWQLAGQIGSITINYDQHHRPELMVSQPGATFVTLQVQAQNQCSYYFGKDSCFFSKSGDCCPNISDSDTKDSGDLNKVSKTKPDNTESSLSVSDISGSNKHNVGSASESKEIPVEKDRRSSHLCADPFEIIGNMLQAPVPDSEDSFIIYHPLAHSQIRNKDTSTVIAGGINRGRPAQDNKTDSDSQPQATYYALATLDGSLNLVENDKILWSLHVDHYLFALAKLDVTGNGKEEVVCCAWSGQTYIVNHSKEIVRYDFPDSVAAFCAGYFSVRDHVNVPCFVYATFNNRICIYPNITLPRVESTNLLKMMGRKEETKELLNKLNISSDDTETVRKLYHWCLYGQHRKT